MASEFTQVGRTNSVQHDQKVDSQGRSYVLAASEAEDRHINQVNGKVWSVTMDTMDIAGGGVITNGSGLNHAQGYIAYMKNTGTKHFHVTDVRAHLTVASVIDIDAVTATTVTNGTAWETADSTSTGHSAIISRNVGTSVSPVGEMYYAGTDTALGGITKLGTLFHGGSLDNQSSHLSTSSNIIIPPGTEVGVRLRTAQTDGVSITFSLIEVTHED